MVMNFIFMVTFSLSYFPLLLRILVFMTFFLVTFSSITSQRSFFVLAMIFIFLVVFSLCCWSWFWSSWLWYPSTTLCFYFEVGYDPHIPHPFHDCDIHLIGHGPFTTCCDLHLPSPFFVGCDFHLLSHVVYLLQVEIFIFLVALSVCYKLWFSSSWSHYLFVTSHDLRFLLFLFHLHFCDLDLLLFLVTTFMFMVVILIFLWFWFSSSFCSWWRPSSS